MKWVRWEASVCDGNAPRVVRDPLPLCVGNGSGENFGGVMENS